MLLMSVLGLAPAHAQDGGFDAWLYESTTGQMIRINETGEVSRLTLPLPDGFDVYPYNGIAVSPDGQTFAYTAGINASFEIELVIYSIRTGGILATYPPSNPAYTSFDLNPTAAFSPDGRQVVFGYSRNGDAGGWEMIVINLDSFSLAGTLTNDSASLAGGFGLTPVPMRFLPDGRVAFALVQAGTEGSPSYDADVWTPASGQLLPTVGYTDLGLEVYEPTGEVLLSGRDSRFPATAGDVLPFGQQNVLSYYSSTTGVVTPFYTDPLTTFYNATFVMNGARILFSADDGDTQEYRLIGRDGAGLGGLTIAPAPYDVAGTHDGFIYMQSIGTTPALLNVILRDGAIDFNETESPIIIGTDATSPRIVWIGDDDPTTAYFTTEPYTPWGAIGTGVSDSNAAGSSAGSSGVGSNILQAGGQATIRTTEGDSLNVRSGSGTGFAIIFKAAPGTLVDLLEGPVSANGYQWWRIRLPSGQEGWAVESAANEVTLVPGTSGSSTSDSNQTANPSVSSGLAIGDSAYVSLSGRVDALRLRNQPSTSGGVVQLMPNSTPVTVIGGPTSADGFTWWQLRAADGSVGWAAEVIGSERVLQKGTAPANNGYTGGANTQPIIAPVTTPEV